MLARRMFQWSMVWLAWALLVVAVVICTNFSAVVSAVTGPLISLVHAALPLVVYIALFIFAGRLFLRCMGIR